MSDIITGLTFPIVLSVIGALFVLLGIAGNVELKGIVIKMPPGRQKGTTVFGIILVLIGVGVYVLPGAKPIPPVTPTPTPTPMPASTASHTPTVTLTPTNTFTPELPTSTLTPTPAPISATVTAKALNLRSGPGTEYAIVGKLAQGDVATVIGQNPGGDWLKVEHKGKTGWVSKEYLEAPPEVAMVPIAEVPPTETPTGTPTTTPTPPTTTPMPPTDTPQPATMPTPVIIVVMPTPLPPDAPTSPPPPPPTATPTITWLHNPALPTPQGLPGDLSYTQTPYPGEEWVNGIEFSVTNMQILIVHGSKARLSDIPNAGEIGRPNNCFLLMTRGPFSSSIDLFTAALEKHNIDSSADALIWAAQKAHDMQAMYPGTCGRGMDIWIGRR